MENPARTAQYHQIIAQRRNDLENFCRIHLPAEAQIVWEIGCGHGHFLTAYASTHPHELCIGVDIESERIERACRKRDRARLTNLHFVHGDARLFLEVLPAGVVLKSIFVLFPDPWPKLRHHKHRIMQPNFLTRLAERAGEECRLCFRTDFEPYFADTMSVFSAHPRWVVREEPWLFEHETVFQSRARAFHSLVARLRDS